MDAIVVKIRHGAVANRPVYVAVGVSADGERDVLGLWAGTGGEGAKQWLAYLSELKSRGVQDVFIVCTDGLKGMTEAVEATRTCAGASPAKQVAPRTPGHRRRGSAGGRHAQPGVHREAKASIVKTAPGVQ